MTSVEMTENNEKNDNLNAPSGLFAIWFLFMDTIQTYL